MIIFVTVGGQLPFDRLVRTVDDWAAGNNTAQVFAQVGKSDYEGNHIETTQFLRPDEFDSRMRGADVIVAHAGMGTILTALEYQKTIVVMPRRAELGEHRNEHQLATARNFREMGTIEVAMDDTELTATLSQAGSLDSASKIGPHASDSLLSALRTFVNER
ncbi:MAG: glycosyltransferase [Planctomycetota bacterium]